MLTNNYIKFPWVSDLKTVTFLEGSTYFNTFTAGTVRVTVTKRRVSRQDRPRGVCRYTKYKKYILRVLNLNGVCSDVSYWVYCVVHSVGFQFIDYGRRSRHLIELAPCFILYHWKSEYGTFLTFSQKEKRTS